MKLNESLYLFMLSMDNVKSPKTYRWYQGHLKSLVEYFGGDTETTDITVHQLRAWRATLTERNFIIQGKRKIQERKITVWTLHSYVRACRRFFRWLVQEDLLVKSPAARLELPPLPFDVREGICDEDRDAMLSAVAHDLRDYAILRFTAATGCREGGIAGLLLSNVRIEKGYAIVKEKGLGGNRQSRVVYFDPQTADALKAWLKIRTDGGSEQMFVRTDGKALTPGGVYQIFRRTADRADVKDGWNPHNWRHAFARNFLHNGGDIGMLSQLLGHSNIQVTQRHYGKLPDKDLRSAHKKYAPFSHKITD